MISVKRLSLDKEQETKRFLDLREQSLTPKNLHWLKWKYFLNSINEPLVFGAINEENNEIVGVRPFISCKLVVGSKIFNAAQPCDTVVDQAYRGQGIFKAMNDYSIRLLKKEGYSLFFNFPNFNSMPGNLKGGWQDIALVDESFCFKNFSEIVSEKSGNRLFYLASLPLGLMWNKTNYAVKQLYKYHDCGYKIQKEDSVNEEFEQLWQKVEQNRIRVERSAEYLRWRFLERPDKNYEIWSARNKDILEGYLIFTLSQRWGTLEGQIVDYQYSSRDAFWKLLGHVLELLTVENGCHFISIWGFTEYKLLEKLKKLGFVNRSDFPFRHFIPQRKMLVKVNDPENLDASFFYNPANWSLRACDQDTY